MVIDIVHFPIDFVVPFDFAIYSSIKKKNYSSFDLAIFLSDTNNVIAITDNPLTFQLFVMSFKSTFY